MPLIKDLISAYHAIQDPDAAKRDQFRQALLANPQLAQQLTDSHLADNPQLLQDTVLGQNARWGGNSSTASSLAGAISNAPLSPQEQADRSVGLQGGVNNIANAGYRSPDVRALNGLSPDQITQQAAPALASGTFATQDQKDMVARKAGLQTSFDKETRNLADLGVKAQTLEASNRSSLLASQNTELANTNALNTDSTKIVDDYIKANPSMRTKKLSDLLSTANDNLVPPGVRSALLTSDKYKPIVSAEIGLDSEKARNALEKRGLDIREQELTEWLPKLKMANAVESVTKYGGGTTQGFLDFYDGKQTPGANEAVQTLNGATPAQKTALAYEYNTKVQALLGNKNISGDAAQAGIAALEPLRQRAQAMGIDNIPQLEYGPRVTTSGVNQGIANSVLPNWMLPKTIHVVGGDTKLPVASYDPNKDVTNLKKKEALFTQLQSENPNLPPAAIQAKVEAQFKRTP